MMHTKVSVDQRTHAEPKELKVKRGRRASASGELGADGEAAEGPKRANHRKYTIGLL